jgi:hypothetical protein
MDRSTGIELILSTGLQASLEKCMSDIRMHAVVRAEKFDTS